VSPEEKYIKKLWLNKVSRRIMIALIIVQAALVFISAGKEVTSLVSPIYKWVFDEGPSKHESKNIRHSFLVGYYTIELFNEMKSGRTDEWPTVFKSFKRRIEASLMALNYKDLEILKYLDFAEPIVFFDQIDRFRILSEGYIDSLGENELSAYVVGLNYSILLRELSQDKPSSDTLNRYYKVLIAEISAIEKRTKYDFGEVLSKKDKQFKNHNEQFISLLADFDNFRSQIGADRML
jgi:hypothetical protein